jgi:hypothetical protein
MLRRAASVVLATGVIALSSCSGNVTSVCDDYALAWCSVRLRCYTGATLTVFEANYQSTPQACQLIAESSLHFNCGGATGPCGPGTSYDTGAAEKCVTDTNAISCADVIAGSDPPSCRLGDICH